MRSVCGVEAVDVQFVVVPELKKEIQKCDRLRERLSADKWQTFFDKLDSDGESMQQQLSGSDGCTHSHRQCKSEQLVESQRYQLRETECALQVMDESPRKSLWSII